MYNGLPGTAYTCAGAPIRRNEKLSPFPVIKVKGRGEGMVFYQRLVFVSGGTEEERMEERRWRKRGDEGELIIVNGYDSGDGDGGSEDAQREEGKGRKTSLNAT